MKGKLSSLDPDDHVVAVCAVGWKVSKKIVAARIVVTRKKHKRDESG